MTLYDAYRNTDYLDDVSFIAGTDFTFYFPVYNNNVLVDINSASMKWALGLYGQPDYLILEKDATVYDNNTFMVSLSASETLSLGDDIYLQQIRVTTAAPENKIIRPAQGIVIIRKAIPMTT